MSPTIKCPDCKKSFGAHEIFQNSSVSWPNQRWIHFRCPACKEFFHVEVANGKLAIGDIDGAPGPCFMITSEIELAGLRIRTNPDGIKCLFEGKDYFFRARGTKSK